MLIRYVTSVYKKLMRERCRISAGDVIFELGRPKWPKVKNLRLKVAVFQWQHLQVQPPDQHRFTTWQTTGRNDGGIRRQAVTSGKLASPDTPTGSQAIAIRHPCSRVKDFDPQLRMAPTV
jgi:hypothetical protein